MATESTQPVSPTSQTEGVDETAPSKEGKGKRTELDPNQKVKSLEEFAKIAPDVWKKTLEGIATNICNAMKHHQERLKKLMREARQK